MTALEMKRMAEIVYESIASNDAPGYDSYEWSVLLSDAQEQIIQELVDKGIEYNDFTKLVFGSQILTSINHTITDDSILKNGCTVTFTTPSSLDEIWLILKDTVNDDPDIKVIPVSYSFYNANIDNPFKKPKTNKFWRLLYNNKLYVVCPTSTLPSHYTIVYLKKPSPIIVPGVNSAIYPTVDGTTVTAGIVANGQNCEYHNTIHKKIVRAAAKLAKLYASDLQGWQAHLTEYKN